MEQHDDHCKLFAAGKIWNIVAVRPGMIKVRRIENRYIIVFAKIDTSEVDWNGYCKAAVEIINRRYR